jgi:hypothetical protein
MRRAWISAAFAVALAACGGSTASTGPGTPADGGVGGNGDAPEDSAPAADAGYLACMSPDGKVDPSLKSCNTVADCTIVEEQTDCCGTMLYVGLASTSASAFGACETAWVAHFPGCGCFSANTTTEDGKTAYPGSDAGAPEVQCASGTCMTYRP